MGLEFVLAWQNVMFLIPLCTGLLLVFGAVMGGTGSDSDADSDVDSDIDADADVDADIDADVDADIDGDIDADADIDADLDVDADADADGDMDDYADVHTHIELASGNAETTALAKADVSPGQHGLVMKSLSMLGLGKVPLTVLLMMSNLIFGGVGIGMNAVLAPIIGVAWIYGLISLAIATISALVLTGGASRLLNRVMPTSETVRITRHGLAGQSGVLLLPADTTGGLAQITDFQGNIHNIRCRTFEGELPKGGSILVVEYDKEKDAYVVAPDPTVKSLTA